MGVNAVVKEFTGKIIAIIHRFDDMEEKWVVDGAKIVGASGMLFVKKPPYFGCPSGKMGMLSSMFTSENYRRQGIAKELLSRIINEA